MNDYCLYFHYTLDTNELFYVGIGRRERAYRTAKQKHNPYWNNIYKKHGRRVEIILIGMTKEEAHFYEKDMIHFFWEQGLAKANLTDEIGGQGWNRGTKGVMKANSGSFKKGQRAWNKEKKGVTPGNKVPKSQATKESLVKSNEWRMKEYPSFINRTTGHIIPAGRGLRQMCKENNLSHSNVSKVMEGIYKQICGYELFVGVN